MTGRTDRSLVLAWGVGLALCGAGAYVTRAASSARVAEAQGEVKLDTAGGMHDLIVREAWDKTVVDTVRGARGEGGPSPAATGGIRGESEPPPAATSERRAQSAAYRGETSSSPALRRSSRDGTKGMAAGTGTGSAPAAPCTLRSALCALRSRPTVARPAPSTPRDTFDSSLISALRDTLRAVLDRAVADSAFPGAYAVVGTSRGVIADYGAGRIDWAPDAPVPTASTIWDLASLTKVVSMTSAMESLVDAGVVSLDAPVQRYLPGFTGHGKERVTVRHLLTHSSGLPAWRPLHKEAETPEARRALVLATPLDTAPGIRYVYSDLGAITLGFMIERLTKQPLDQYVMRRVFEPLGMRDTRYRPDSSLLPRIAPTEIDPWRQRHLRGEVHDENAFALGGVSAHAGLFSTGYDLARLARMYLGGGTLEGRRFVARGTIGRFTRVQDTTISRRALGWETPTGSNSAGRYMGPHAFGHTGFTGTSMWMDPERDLFVILLTNRVNPSRQNTRISRVRVALADAVVQTVAAHGGRPATPLPSVPRP
jgi:serine-type D-Ala-D-Ala carboxypeptidase